MNILRILRWTLLTIIALLLTIVIAWQFKSVRQQVDSYLVHTIASQTGWSITADELTLTWPLALKGQNVHFESPEGLVVSIDKVYCQPSWRILFASTYAFEKLHLSDIHLTQPPELEKAPTISAFSDTTTSLVEIPLWDYTLTINDLSIGNIHWHSSSAPSWVKLFQNSLMQGSLFVHASSHAGSAQLHLIGQNNGKANLLAEWLSDDDDLCVKATIDDEGSYLTAAILDIDAAEKFHLESNAEGPLNTWHHLLSGTPVTTEDGTISGNVTWSLSHHTATLSSNSSFTWDSHLQLDNYVKVHAPLPAEVHLTTKRDLATGLCTIRYKANGNAKTAPLPSRIQIDNFHIDGQLTGNPEKLLEGTISSNIETSLGQYQVNSNIHYNTLLHELLLNKISLESALLDIQGNIKAELFTATAPITLEGLLHATIDENAVLSRWLPGIAIPLGSQLSIHLERNPEVNQQAQLIWKLPQIDYKSSVAKNTTISVKVNELLTNPTAEAEISVDEISYADRAKAKLKVHTKLLPQQQWPYTCQCSGLNLIPWQINTAGLWYADHEHMLVICQQLTGKIAQAQISLKEPWQLRFESDLATASPLYCRIGDGNLTASFQHTENTYQSHISYDFLRPSTLAVLLPQIAWQKAAEKPWLLETDFTVNKDDGQTTLQVAVKPQGSSTTQATKLDLAVKDIYADVWDINTTFHQPHKHSFLNTVTEYSQAVSAEVRFQGQFTRNNGDLDGNLTLNGTTYGLPVTFQGHVHTSPTVWELKEGHGTLAGGNLTGNISFDRIEQQVDGTFIGSLLPDNPLLAILPLKIPLKGRLNIKGPWLAPKLSWKLDTSQPLSLNLEGEGSVDANQFKGQLKASSPHENSTLQASASVESNWSLGSLYLNHLQAQGFATEITGQMTLNKEEHNTTGKLDLKAESEWLSQTAIASSQISATLDYANLKEQPLKLTFYDKQGRVSGEAQAFWQMENGFTLTLAQAELQLDTHTIKLSKPCQLNVNEGTFNFKNLQLAIDNGYCHMDGSGDSNTFSLSIKGQTLPLHLLQALSVNSPIDGTLNLQGKLAGPWDKPQGELHLEAPEITLSEAFFHKAPFCQATAYLNLEGSQLKVEGKLQCPQLAPLTVQAALPVTVSLWPLQFNSDTTAPLTADLRASGSITALLDLLLIDLSHASGDVTAALSVRGSLDKPELQGQVTLKQGSYENLYTGTVLRDVIIKAYAEGSKLQIEQLNAHDNRGGRFSAVGSLTVDPHMNFPFQLKGRLERMTLVHVDLGHSAFNGELVLQGNRSGCTLSGNLDVVSAGFNLPEDLSSSAISTVDVTYVNIPPGKQAPLTIKKAEPLTSYPLQLDLKLRTASALKIESQALESNWRGQVHVSGDVQVPQIHGDLHISEGIYRFGGKSFELHQGLVSLAGPPDKAALYVIAKLDIDDITVEVIVRGPIKNPTIAFRSNPALSQQEILSYLLFGKGLSEITPYQGNQLSYSISTLTAAANNTPNLLDKVRSALSIDLGIGRAPTREGNKVSLQLGRQLSNRVYVSLNRNITDEINSVALEAQVIKNLKLRGEINDEAEPQLFLKWKRDF